MAFESGFLRYILYHIQRLPVAGTLIKKIMIDRKLRLLLITSFLVIKAITALIFIFLIPALKRNI